MVHVSDDFGLRSVLSHSETISDEKFYLYRSMRRGGGGVVLWCVLLAMLILRTVNHSSEA